MQAMAERHRKPAGPIYDPPPFPRPASECERSAGHERGNRLDGLAAWPGLQRSQEISRELAVNALETNSRQPEPVEPLRARDGERDCKTLRHGERRVCRRLPCVSAQAIRKLEDRIRKPVRP